MISESFGGVILISVLADDKSVWVSGLFFPEERNRRFLSITACQLRFIRLRSSKAEKKYTNNRLLRDFSGRASVQDRMFSNVSVAMLLVNTRASFKQFVKNSICPSVRWCSKMDFVSNAVKACAGCFLGNCDCR